MSIANRDYCWCAACRRMVRERIATAYRERRRWISQERSKQLAVLEWVPEAVYLDEFFGLTWSGLLIASDRRSGRVWIWWRHTLPTGKAVAR
jgi:hypothetical protein